MGVETIWCPVLQAHVTCITDLEDRVVKVICHEYDSETRTCRMKQQALKNGPLAQFLVSASENSAARTLRCAIA
jgi:hypothetical protein